MTKEKHTERHWMLHKHLDELIADFLLHTNKTLTKTNLLEFMMWSYTQAINPTEKLVTIHCDNN